MVNSTTSSCKNCMILIRILVLKCMTANVRLFIKYVKSTENIYSDTLSRGNISYFKKKRTRHDELPTPIPKEISPPKTIWLK